MRADEYVMHDGLGLADLVRRGEVTPAELVEAAFAVIERHDPALNAVVMRDAEGARRAANAAPTGPFAGVPFLAKDTNQDVAPFPTTHGSRFLLGSRPRRDGELATRWRAAGLIVLGKTNTPEFATDFVTEPLAYGPTRNPWNEGHTPGGSSGGAAAAVASGMVPIAHGTDAGGSIRVPASACHLVGFKPTRGRVPVGPARGEVWFGLNHEHVLTRSVRDSAAMLDATGGSDPGAPYGVPMPERPFLDEVGRDPGRLRIGLATVSPSGITAAPLLRDAVLATGHLLESLGHDLEPFRWPAGHDAGAVAGLMSAVGAAGEIAICAEELGRQPGIDDLEPLTRWLVAEARGMTALDVAAALHQANLLRRRIAATLAPFDALLCPTTATLPPAIGAVADHGPGFDAAAWGARSYGYAPFTEIFNLTGQPAVSLPAGIDPATGLPLAIQLAAPFGRDDVLFRLAGQIERARPWSDRRPPRFG